MSLPEKPAVAAHVSDNAENGLDVIQRSNLMDNLRLEINKPAPTPMVNAWLNPTKDGFELVLKHSDDASDQRLFHFELSDGKIKILMQEICTKKLCWVDVSAHVVNAEVAKLIRTHCQPREVYNAPELLDVANKAFDFLSGVDGAAEIRAELLSAIAKATQP